VNDPFDHDDAWPGPQLLASWTVPTLPSEFADRVLFDWHGPRGVPSTPARERRRMPGTIAIATIAAAIAMAAIVVLWLVPRNAPMPVQDPRTNDDAAVAHPVRTTTSLVLQVSPRDAVVRVDGIPIAGPTPFVATALAVGPHDLEVRRDGFVPVTKMVDVDHDGLQLSLVLDVADVVLEIATDPPGAEVRIVAGTRELARGRGADRFAIHRTDGEEIALEVTAPGFQSRRVPVRFSGEPQDRIDVALVPDLGAFFPPAPEIEPGSGPIAPKFGPPPSGRSPAREGARKSIPPTPFDPHTTDLQDPFAGKPAPEQHAGAGDLKNPFVRSAPAARPSAVLRIGVLPGNGPAKVYVDGRLVGTTPIANARVTPGTHHVRWEWGDGRMFKQTITVAADETLVVKGGV